MLLFIFILFFFSYMFTSSFQEETEIDVLTPPESKPYEGSSSMVRFQIIIYKT